MIISLLFAGAVIVFVVIGVREDWMGMAEGGKEWNGMANITMMQVDQIVAVEYWENNGSGTRVEEAAWLHDQLHAYFGTNLIPVVKLDQYLDAESNVLKCVELKTKASFETNYHCCPVQFSQAVVSLL